MSKRAKRIQDSISIEKVLQDIGYPVRGGGLREEQFPCDLHGDGRDGAFSARVYPESSSWYCFACGKSRDAIETYRDKFGLEFGEACELLEKKYGLSVWKWTPKNNNEEEVEEEIDTSEQDYESIQQRVERLLVMVQREKPMLEVLAFWEGYDCILWHVEKELWDFKRASAGLRRIHSSLLRGRSQ